MFTGDFTHPLPAGVNERYGDVYAKWQNGRLIFARQDESRLGRIALVLLFASSPLNRNNRLGSVFPHRDIAFRRTLTRNGLREFCKRRNHI